MTPQAAGEMVRVSAQEVSLLLGRAAALAKAAATCASEADQEAAVDILLQVEPLLFDARTLLNAACLMHRRADPGTD